MQATTSLEEKILQIRSTTEKLCAPLATEDYVVQPILDVSPPKWHLAHTTWFFEEFILVPNKENYKVFNPNYCFLFNSYYDHVGDRVLRHKRGVMTRPTVEEIYNYRTYVTNALIDFVTHCSDPEVLSIIEIGLNHEQQHQELLMTDLKYILFQNPLYPAYLSKPPSNNPETSVNLLEYLEMDEGMYTIGYQGSNFYFDNEKGVHQVFLQAFKIADRLITNREYLDFVKDGGYKNFKYWLSEAWAWVKEHNIKSPRYWVEKDNIWHQFTLYGLQPINLDEPVSHVSYFEADAYASWCGKRLPSEFEWEAASKKYEATMPKYANFLELGNFSPKSHLQSYQFLGDAWEWTQSAYLPYPYYKKREGALGEYNGKFMINQMVLRGGSCVTSRSHIRHSYRNFFHPHLQWQFTGIRLAEHC